MVTEKRFRMVGLPKSGASLVGVALLITVAACGPAQANTAPVTADNQTITTVAAALTPQPATTVLWGRLPYCNCFAGSATVNVANALKAANLTVTLQELSPRDGWLYVAVTFDSQAATAAQVGDAMIAGGAELLDGPP